MFLKNGEVTEPTTRKAVRGVLVCTQSADS